MRVLTVFRRGASIFNSLLLEDTMWVSNLIISEEGIHS